MIAVTVAAAPMKWVLKAVVLKRLLMVVCICFGILEC